MGGITFSYDLLTNPQFIKYRYKEEISNEGVFAVYPSETVNGNNFTKVYNLRHEWLNGYGDSLVTEAHLVKRAASKGSLFYFSRHKNFILFAFYLKNYYI